jgi:hypothetical protein
VKGNETLIAWLGSVCAAGAALAGFRRDSTWSLVIGLALFAASLSVLLGLGARAAVGPARAFRPRRTRVRRPTGWTYTSDGFLSVATMNALQKVSSHPGFLHADTRHATPWVQVAVLVPCEPLAGEPSTSALKDAFLAFLGNSVVRSVVSPIVGPIDARVWAGYAGNGRRLSEAILAASGEDVAEAPCAAALLLLEQSGEHFQLKRGGAELVLRIQMAGIESKLPASLEWWHRWLLNLLELPDAFQEFLARELHLATHEDPAASVGFRLESQSGLDQLFDVRSYPVLPGRRSHRQWLGYFNAMANGQLSAKAAADALTAVCDYGIGVQDYEVELDRLTLG